MFRSIQKKVFWVYMTVTVGVFFLSYIILYQVELGNRLNQTINSSKVINEIFAQETSEQLFEAIEQLEIIAGTQVEAFDDKRLLSMLKTLNATDHYGFLTNFYIDLEGTVYFTNGEINNSSDRDYFLEIVNNQPDYVISKPIIGRESNQEVFVIGVPLIIKDEIRGMVAGSISLNTLSEVINNKTIPLNGYAWIIESEGLVIAHPDPEIRMTTNLVDNERFISESGLGIWDEMQKQTSGVIRYTDMETFEERVLTYIEIDQTKGWKLGITTKMSDIQSEMDDFRLLMIGVASLTTFLLVYFNFKISQSMVKPILDLTEAVSQSDNGHIKKLRVEVTNDEIGVLVKAYNQLAEEIDDYTHKLEILVDERTEELRALTEVLESRNIKLEKSNLELNSIASTDPLTGLVNRRFLFKEIQGLVDRVENDQIREFSLIFADLDNFKYYNDRFGHDIGDNILKCIGHMIVDSFRSSDVVSRYGGDEFVILLPNVNKKQAEKISKKLTRIFEGQGGFHDKLCKWLNLNRRELILHKLLGCSYGVVTYTKGNYEDVDTLIKHADELMYEHKKLQKKDRVYPDNK